MVHETVVWIKRVVDRVRGKGCNIRGACTDGACRRCMVETCAISAFLTAFPIKT